MANTKQESTTQLSFPPDLIDTPYILQIVNQSINYINAGLFIHLQGNANTGKTTFARYVACLLQQPVIVIHSQIHNQEAINLIWQAATQGHTIIFEECQRANKNDWQVLLSVLEEHLLNFPLIAPQGKYSHFTHPGFAVILTSNPYEENAPKLPLQDLNNYAIKIPLQGFDIESEEAILKAKSGINSHSAKVLAHILRRLRANKNYKGLVSIKLGIMIGRALKTQDISAQHQPVLFQKFCENMLIIPNQPDSLEIVKQTIESVLTEFVSPEVVKEEVKQVIVESQNTIEKEIVKPDIDAVVAEQELEQVPPQKPVKTISVMLHSEVELEMHFFDEVISFMQNISNEEAEVSFHHPGDAVQPDIMVKIAESFLPQILTFIEKYTNDEVVLIRNYVTEFYECDVLIKIPATVPPEKPQIKSEEKNLQPTSAQSITTAQNSPNTNQAQAPDTNQVKIQKLKKLIANYEKFHSRQ